MHIFTKAAKRILLLSLIISFSNIYSSAQNNSSDSTKTTVANQTGGIKVTGTVKEASTGKPLSGISISVPRYSATLTDDQGLFTINVPDNSASLMVSGPGFQRREVAVKGRSSVDVNLFEDAYHSVYDDANMPYGTDPLNQIVHSVSSITSGGNWERTVETPDTWLQGRATGLNVIRRSGTPAIGADLFLRGFTSLNATNQPLYVVDGIIYDVNSYGNSLITGHLTNPLADIDIKDIDNVTIIRDGASMYGTRGANGVILITTGRARDVATKIDFAVSGGFNAAPRHIPVMNAADYRIYLSDLLKTSSLTDDQILALPFMNDNQSNPDYFRYHNETDWQKEVMKNSYNQNYYLKVTGGDDIATYALSVGSTSNKGIISSTGLSRYFMRFNSNFKISSKLSADANLAFTSSEQILKDQGINTKTNPIYLSLIKAPFLPINEMGDDGAKSPNLADADIFGVSNPTAAIREIQDINKNYRFSGGVGLYYDLTQTIKISTLIGLTFDKVRENIFVPNVGIAHDTLSLAVATNRSGSNVQRLFSLYNDTRISYNKIFNFIHDVSVNAGARYNLSSSQDDFGLGYNSATDNFVSVGNGVNALRRAGGEVGDWNWLNMYINADYKFKNKYFISFNTAIDGSSRFGKKITKPMTLSFAGNKFAVLPSLGAGWLISSENFMSQFKFIDMLKLRASIGLVGNDDIGNYNARQYYVSQNLLGVQGLVRGNIANPALKWETVQKQNIGVDFAFLDERMNLSLDLFKNITTDMITLKQLNSVSGFKYAITNDGGMKTSGMELAINGRVINKELKWDIGFMIMTAKNKLSRIPDNSMITDINGATILTEVGKPANLFYGYKTNGILNSDAEATSAGLSYRNPNGTLSPFQAGDVRFVDTDGDFIIDENDRQVIGNPNPEFTGSISNVVSWKRFSFDCLITFSKGNDIFNYTRSMLESMAVPYNQTVNTINRWRTNDQVTNVPRASLGDPSGNSRFSDRWIEDGSYLRLRTMSVTYDLPVKSGIIIKYAKIYATGNNIFTITRYLGYDPEFSASGSVFTRGTDTGLEPQFKSVQLGLRIGF